MSEQLTIEINAEDNTSDVFRTVSGGLDNLGGAILRGESLWNRYDISMLRLENASDRVTSAQERVKDAQEKYTDAVAKFGEDSPQAKKALEDLDQANRNLEISSRNLEIQQKRTDLAMVSVGVSAVGLALDTTKTLLPALAHAVTSFYAMATAEGVATAATHTLTGALNVLAASPIIQFLVAFGPVIILLGTALYGLYHLSQMNTVEFERMMKATNDLTAVFGPAWQVVQIMIRAWYDLIRAVTGVSNALVGHSLASDLEIVTGCVQTLVQWVYSLIAAIQSAIDWIKSCWIGWLVCLQGFN